MMQIEWAISLIDSKAVTNLDNLTALERSRAETSMYWYCRSRTIGSDNGRISFTPLGYSWFVEGAPQT